MGSTSLKFLPVMVLLILLSVFLFPRLRRDSMSVDDAKVKEPNVGWMASNQTASAPLQKPDSVEDVEERKPEIDSTNWLNTFSNSGTRSNTVTAADKRQEQTEAPKIVNPARTNTPDLTPLEWIWIPPGKFIMGSPEEERGRRSHEPQNEGPQTEITIQNGFWLGKYEVTLGQFREVTGDAPKRPYPWRATDPDQAFANASWKEGMKFCAALTMRERESGRLPDGYVCRLPTEAEWEYACRAGSVTRYSFGDDDALSRIDAFVWFRENH